MQQGASYTQVDLSVGLYKQRKSTITVKEYVSEPLSRHVNSATNGDTQYLLFRLFYC